METKRARTDDGDGHDFTYGYSRVVHAEAIVSLLLRREVRAAYEALAGDGCMPAHLAMDLAAVADAKPSEVAAVVDALGLDAEVGALMADDDVSDATLDALGRAEAAAKKRLRADASLPPFVATALLRDEFLAYEDEGEAEGNLRASLAALVDASEEMADDDITFSTDGDGTRLIYVAPALTRADVDDPALATSDGPWTRYTEAGRTYTLEELRAWLGAVLRNTAALRRGFERKLIAEAPALLAFVNGLDEDDARADLAPKRQSSKALKDAELVRMRFVREAKAIAMRENVTGNF